MASRDRESYLNEKEIEMLRTLFKEIKLCFEDFFTEDIKGDQNIINCLKLFSYKWDKFKVLRDAYESGKTRDKSSNLKNKLSAIASSLCCVHL